MKIVHLKLVNGDDLLAGFISETSNTYIINHPLVVDERETVSGAHSIVLSKYVQLTGNDDIEIKKEHVIFCTTVEHEFEKFYTVSRSYNAKYIDKQIATQVEKVSNAMEDVLMGNGVDLAKSIKLTANTNTSIH